MSRINITCETCGLVQGRSFNSVHFEEVMEDNKTKQGESTPEEYLEKNTKYGNHSVISMAHALEALEMARKSEREKVIDQAIEKIKRNALIVHPIGLACLNKSIEILNNLKKEKP
jgi:hypothetical protein